MPHAELLEYIEDVMGEFPEQASGGRVKEGGGVVMGDKDGVTVGFDGVGAVGPAVLSYGPVDSS